MTEAEWASRRLGSVPRRCAAPCEHDPIRTALRFAAPAAAGLGSSGDGSLQRGRPIFGLCPPIEGRSGFSYRSSPTVERPVIRCSPTKKEYGDVSLRIWMSLPSDDTRLMCFHCREVEKMAPGKGVNAPLQRSAPTRLTIC